MKLIHVQTQITTIVGWLDDDDNIVETATLQAQPTDLKDATWLEQLALIRDKRDELKAERKAAESAAGNGQPANREQRRAAAKRTRAKAAKP